MASWAIVRPNSSASACPAVSAPCPYSTVVVADNALLTFTPDIVASVPTMLPGLTDKQRTAYLAHQQACLTSRVYSQQWCAIRHRYGLRTALAGPTTLTEQRTARLAARGVRLTWA